MWRESENNCETEMYCRCDASAHFLSIDLSVRGASGKNRVEMKKKLIFLFVLFGCVFCIHAQDVITERNGNEILAKILEVNPDEVKYKRFDNQNGPLYTIRKSDVLFIKYENGTSETFDMPAVTGENDFELSADYGTVANVHSGMRYKDYKDFYIPSAYVYQPGDRYVPAVGGVCSWLIPGLGQMICGEVGRGFAYLGGALGSSVVMSVGIGVFGTSFYYLDGNYKHNQAQAAFGLIMTLAGSIALMTVDICAIVDGVRVAKIKNMYEQDLRKMSSSLQMELSPYLSMETVGYSRFPVAGFAVKLAF